MIVGRLLLRAVSTWTALRERYRNTASISILQPGVWSRSRSLSFEENSDYSGPYLSHMDWCVILLQSI